MEKKLAKIKEATLTISEGFLSFSILVDYEEGGLQYIGNFSLDSWDKKLSRRVGTAYGCEIIRQLIERLGVNEFSELKGKVVWVWVETTGGLFIPKGLEGLRVEENSNIEVLERAVMFDKIYSEFITTSTTNALLDSDKIVKIFSQSNYRTLEEAISHFENLLRVELLNTLEKIWDKK